MHRLHTIRKIFFDIFIFFLDCILKILFRIISKLRNLGVIDLSLE